MSGLWNAVQIHPNDTVAVALCHLSGVAKVRSTDGILELLLTDDVPMGHKLSLCEIAAGEVVRKYGETIGEATATIRKGGHVHTHNLRSRRALAPR